MKGSPRRRTGTFLEVAGNGTSYGIFVEMNPERLPAGETEPDAVYGPDATPFLARTDRPERPGTYCFPPVAALITAGARLILALVR